jgi:hypothetical protein
VCAGHEALIVAAADLSSFSESGASGCVATALEGRDDGVSAATSVDMLIVWECGEVEFVKRCSEKVLLRDVGSSADYARH